MKVPSKSHRKKPPEKHDCCATCGTNDNEESIILCDICDKEYHIHCLVPPLPTVPEGNWYCAQCLRVHGTRFEYRGAKVYWTDDKAWYDCRVLRFEKESGRHQLVYNGKPLYLNSLSSVIRNSDTHKLLFLLPKS